MQKPSSEGFCIDRIFPARGREQARCSSRGNREELLPGNGCVPVNIGPGVVNEEVGLVHPSFLKATCLYTEERCQLNIPALSSIPAR